MHKDYTAELAAAKLIVANKMTRSKEFDQVGPSNDPRLLQQLVGETIQGTLISKSGHIYLILSNGGAVVFSGASYWKESPTDVRNAVESRRAEIKAHIDALQAVTNVMDHVVVPLSDARDNTDAP